MYIDRLTSRKLIVSQYKTFLCFSTRPSEKVSYTIRSRRCGGKVLSVGGARLWVGNGGGLTGPGWMYGGGGGSIKVFSSRMTMAAYGKGAVFMALVGNLRSS